MKKQVLILLSFAFMLGANALPLQGVYTLDSASATSGTNYQTWTDFRNAIVTNGISSAITLNVLSNCTESGSIVFTAITGASAVNTIRINGNGKYLKTSSSDGVIILNGADYFTIDTLKVINTAAGIGVRLYNRADYNTISRCILQFTSINSSNLNTGAYIAITANPTSLATVGASENGKFNKFLYNSCHTLNPNSPGPAYGILVTGSNSSYKDSLQGNLVYGNRIFNFYHRGIAVMFGNGNQIVRNEVCRKDADTALSNATVYGIYATESYTNGVALRIDSNFVHHLPCDSSTVNKTVPTVYGVYVEKHNGSSIVPVSLKYNLVARMRAGTYMAAIVSYTNHHADISYNAMLDNDMPSTALNYCMYNGVSLGNKKGVCKLTNNTITACDGAFYWYGFNIGTPLNVDQGMQISNNMIVRNGGAYYAFRGIYSVNNNLNDTSWRFVISANRIGVNYGQTRIFTGINTENYGAFTIEDNLIDSNTSGTQNFYGIYTYNYQYDMIRRNRIEFNKAASSTAIMYGVSCYNNYRVSILSNLIVKNISGYQLNGIHVYESLSSPNRTRVVQNTVIGDGKNFSNKFPTINPYNITSYYQGITFKGNISDVRNAYSMDVTLSTYTSLRSSFNSFFTDTSVKVQLWKTNLGNASTDTGLFRMIGDSTSKVPSAGHFFNSQYGSTWYYNQNNVPSDPDNLSDVYGSTRSNTFSDRGAVEYNGSTGISDPAAKLSLTAYPNPNDGKFTVVSKINTEYRIYDINGKIVLSGKLIEGSNSIDASVLLEGIYYLLSSAGTDALRLIIR